MEMLKQFKKESLNVKCFDKRDAMGAQAATDVRNKIKSLLKLQRSINIIFGAAPSQDELLEELSQQEDIDWARINAFHMDEYIGLDKADPKSFGSYLDKNIFKRVPFQEVYYINGKNKDVSNECRRYTHLLKKFPADIVCMGIGENTHIAFNEPHDADFADPFWVKEVLLEEKTRQQQVNDGCFLTLNKVPTSAITLTIPALFSAKYIYCVVPGRRKANAVYLTLNEQINDRHPSTILRRHKNAILYLDRNSLTAEI